MFLIPFINLFSLCSQGSDSADAKSGGVFFSGKPVVRKAMELADLVMKDSAEQRLKMPTCLDPSDEEEVDEEDMEVSSAKPKETQFYFVGLSFANIAPDFT